MYELNRARLVGIGPRGARYSDVTLDLSGLGDTVPPANLFDPPGRRPSPFSLLLLENGGGKSVLLKLLFSVVLPGRRNTVGGASLDKFVLDSDTGHVALEWMHVTTGDRLVTAKVYERRTRSSDKNPVAEAWYSFRPSTTLTLDTLPVTEDGRRRRLAGYNEAVHEAERIEPATQLSWAGDDQGRWRRHLRESGLEPDLFDIQRRMNVDEGEAAKAFKYTSSKEFVDWLLTTVTDPEDAASVATTFNQWAANLAEREQMLLERDFLEGAIAGLEPLADAHQAHHEASLAAASATGAAEQLAAALASRLDAERDTVARLTQAQETAQGLVVSRSGERDAAREVLNEVRRQTLLLELEQATQERTRLQGELDSAELELHGWETVPEVAERDRAIATADQLAAQVASADQDAAPALARRDQAAGLLLAKYHAEAAASERDAAGHDRQVELAKQDAATADTERTEALRASAVVGERYRAAQATITQATERLTAASEAGLIGDGTTPAQLPEIAEGASQDHAAKLTQAEDAKTAAAGQATRCQDLAAAASIAEKALREATTAAEIATGELATVEDEARRLASLPAIRAAAGDPIEPAASPDESPTHVEHTAAALSVDTLDDSADRILDQLGADIAAHTEQLDDLRAKQHEDSRVSEALGDGGLLPPRHAVERALQVLDAAGVAAHAGWRYLHDAARADERSDLIASHPALADGIVLVDAGQLTDARHALAEARLLPAAAIAVGSGAALLHLNTKHPTEHEPTDGFVIEPNLALYDEDAAAERQEELAEQMERRGLHIQQTTEQLDTVREAHTQLQQWRRTNPAGRLATLRDELSLARGRQQSAQEKCTAALGELEEAQEISRQLDAALERAAAEERKASERAAQLAGLAELVKNAAQAQRQLPELETEDSKHQAAAGAALSRRQKAERDQSEHLKLGEQARAQAQRHRAACSEVISTSGQVAPAVPEESLAELKASAEAAQQVYLAVAVDPDLRRQADDAAGRVKALRAQLELRDPAHLAEAERLHATPAGADPAAWSTGASNARARAATLRDDVAELTARTGRLQERVTSASPTEPGRRSWTTLGDRWRPTSIQRGQELDAEAVEELARAQTRLDEAANDLTRIERERATAEEAARGFNEARLPLAARLDNTPTPAAPVPYPDDIETAKDAATAAVDALRETQSHLDTCRTTLALATQELIGFANQSRYESLATSARRSIVESAHEFLASQASDWSLSLRARLATLTNDLENANRHRKTIVDRLAALVEQSVKTLRQASKLSRLPEDLAEWGGRPFLQIKFSEPDRTATSVHVGQVVDKVAGQYAARAVGGKSRNARRDGMSLLLEAVHAAVPKGFTVDVLKPDSVLRDERVSIEEMNDVFSGGQELTAAIVLYCTLAALSANKRGQMRSRHSGVLFLDNPIGRANASYLIDLQQSVARSLGVQLIYTTGISDDRVLAAFPLWIRLRNDADLRAGLKHIQVADVVRRQLPAPYSAEELVDPHHAGGATNSAPGTVTATRVHRRPSTSRGGPAATAVSTSGTRDPDTPVPVP